MSARPATKTTTAMVDITCPEWCTTADPQEHADELWNTGGCVIHNHPGYRIEDQQGHMPSPLTNPIFGKVVQVAGGIETTPDGRWQATPMVNLQGIEMTPQQALAVAAGLAMLVAELTYPVVGPHPVLAAYDPLFDLAEKLDEIGRMFVEAEEVHRARG